MRLPQLVPQAELGMCCNARRHVPPHSTHPFPALQFGCSSLAKASSPNSAGVVFGKEHRSSRAQGQASGCGHSRKAQVAERGHAAG